MERINRLFLLKLNTVLCRRNFLQIKISLKGKLQFLANTLKEL